MSTVLRVEQLTVGFGDTVLLADMNAEFVLGELVCVLGPNGTGKSSLLRTLTQQQASLGGHCLLKNRQLPSWHPRELAQALAVVLTEMPRIDFMSVEQLVGLGRHPYGSWRESLCADNQLIIQDAMSAMQVEHLAGRDITTLSDGELQRAYVARAIAQDPLVMVLDEPTAFLDVMHSAHTFDLLRTWAHNNKRLAIMVTHDLTSALSLSDRMGIIYEKKLFIDSPEAHTRSGLLERVFANDRLVFNVQSGRVEPKT